MKMNIQERLVVLGILPKESSYAVLRVMTDLQRKLSFTEKELKEFEIKQEENQVTWHPEKGAVEVDIPMGEKATDIIVEALEKLDKEKKLTFQHYSLFEKFVKKKED